MLFIIANILKGLKGLLLSPIFPYLTPYSDIIDHYNQKIRYMSTKKIIYTKNAPSPVGPYSQAVATQGELIFIAGQIALNPETGEIVGEGDITLQTKQVMTNIEAILTEAGVNWSNVIKTSVFLQDLTHFKAMNEVYAQYFNENPPARACVEVSRLPKDVLVEIECIAAKG